MKKINTPERERVLLEVMTSFMECRRKTYDYYNDWGDALREYMTESTTDIIPDTVRGETIINSMDTLAIINFLDWLFEEA